ncbi:MAG: triose-phosphate isomerase [Rhodobacterales bacterium]|nr:triose-phosphate isomerase [Rhodobacterales bacterium]
MARVPFIAGNWKLNKAPSEAAALAKALKHKLADRGDVTVAVFPTALSIQATLQSIAGSGVGVGIQDISVSPRGAYTGTNSGVMARALGCTYVLVGHSERRLYYGEDEAKVSARIRAGLDAGLLPIVCVGETLAQRRAGQADAVVHDQLAGALVGLNHDEVVKLTLAYEPVWAIGTGETATPAQAQAVHASIRSWLTNAYPAYIPNQMRIQYGGSVKPSNAAELLACPDIDGALVGGASLNAEDFAAIVAAAIA